METFKRVFPLAVFFVLFTTSALGLLSSQALGLDKLRFGTGYKQAPNYNLIMWAGEEQGIWRKNGLEVEWVPFAGSGVLLRAAAAGGLDMGAGRAEAALISIARGVPAVIVGDYLSGAHFEVYVKSESPLRHPADLKGAKIALASFGSADHAIGQYLFRVLGLSGLVKFVVVGGLPSTMAALRQGHVDGIIQGFTAVAEFVTRGEIRTLVSSKGYLPKDWVDNTIFATRSLLAEKPEAVGRAVEAHFQAMEFSKANRAWTLDKLKSRMGYSEAAAEMIYEIHFPRREKRVNPEGIKNVLNFLVEFGLIK